MKVEERPLRNCFVLQWHLTARCEYNCKHCYMHDSPTYDSEIKNELNFDTCINIIEDFHTALSSWGIPGRINFTGGDPLIREDLFDMIKYANGKGLGIGILGNPDKLTDEIAKKLKESGVLRYQISIDGMEKTHDSLRGRKGAFKEAIKAIHVLNKVGLPSIVMFTLSKANSSELLNVIRLVAKEKVCRFDFARLVPIGTGEELREQILTPNEYRGILLKVLECYQKLNERGCQTHFGRKEHLWRLLNSELGLIGPLPKNREMIYSGCSIGANILTILADGTVLPCRRLPIPIGKVPEEKIRKLFIYSSTLNKLRQIHNMDKCSRCELLQFCRGCPAVAYGTHGRWNAPDPQCWKEL